MTSRQCRCLSMSTHRDGDGRFLCPEVDRDHRFDGVFSAEVAAVDVDDGDPSTHETGVAGCVLSVRAFHSCGKDGRW